MQCALKSDDRFIISANYTKSNKVLNPIRETHQYNTRKQRPLNFHRINTARFSFNHSGPTVFNKLPVHVRDLPITFHFKTKSVRGNILFTFQML